VIQRYPNTPSHFTAILDCCSCYT